MNWFMLSRTSEYALRALIHLAQHEEDWPISGAHVAGETGIPAKYLSKILGDLVRAGVLDSFPGKTGGFRLRRSAKSLSLLDVLAPFEQFDRRRCPFGNEDCSDEHPCNAHDQWKKVIETEQRFLIKTTVRDIALRMSEDGPKSKTRARKRRPKS